MLEEENCDKIIMIPCGGNNGWYEIAENSALIYYYRVCETLKLKVNFGPDTDSFYSPYEIGRIRVRSPEAVKKRIQNAGYLKGHAIKNYCHIFTLDVKLKKEDLAWLKAKEFSRREENLGLVKINYGDPTLHHDMVEVSARLHKLCSSNLDRISGQTNGFRIVEMIDGMILRYYRMCDGKESTFDDVTWQLFLDETNELLYEIELLSEVKLWSYETCVGIVKTLLRMKKKFENAIKVAEKREEEKMKRMGAKGLDRFDEEEFED